ncbi:MAG: restriction endonuclease [Bacteroidetes bacterium]|nr:restriction endonuclease [Bacteroidota bacterium]
MSDKIKEALQILIDLGVPKGQQNERTALCLLALTDIKKNSPWIEAQDPLIGITPMMEFAKTVYKREYAPNTRETFRRQSMHQLVDAGIALYNPDRLDRPVNSPKAVYQIAPLALHIVKLYGTDEYPKAVKLYHKKIGALAERYQATRNMEMIPVENVDGLKLSPGKHSQLIKEIIENFAPRFIPGSRLLYAGDTGNKWGYFDKETFVKFGISIDEHGKMPDCIFYLESKGWLVLVESVTSHGPIDSKRRIELEKLFITDMTVIYVTAFPDKQTFTRFTAEIAWETEVWLSDNPTHLIHFNGDKFLG